ncbi:MAG: hypothetical protein NTW20_11690 [Rhodobacterales bacterium]|nr:hypothetical protein [Rhodobacterales bacterium]
MIRLAVSPLLIALGVALTAHFLALAWADWAACFEDAAGQTSLAYRKYLVNLLSHPGMAILTLGAPFLPFLLVAPFLRAPKRLVWQWIGIGTTIAVLALLLSGLSSAQTCPDEGNLSEYGIPELIPMVFGGGVGFTIFLVVTYIGSIRDARGSAC